MVNIIVQGAVFVDATSSPSCSCIYLVTVSPSASGYLVSGEMLGENTDGQQLLINSRFNIGTFLQVQFGADGWRKGTIFEKGIQFQLHLICKDSLDR